MEQKIKFEYSYFIEPFIIKTSYEKFLLKMIHNPRCNIHFFGKEKDANLYTYFLPKTRKSIFWSLDYTREKIRLFNEFDDKMKVNILSKYEAVFFDYDVEDNIQAKIQEENGIYFNISKIQIICFKNGVSFLLIKTLLDEDSTIRDLINFNYKFRDINLKVKDTKNFDNIKLQVENYDSIDSLSKLLKRITGDSDEIEELDISSQRFLTYSFFCVGQEDWNSDLQKAFYKLLNVKSADYVVDNLENDSEYDIDTLKSLKYGIGNNSTILMVNDTSVENFTKLPLRFENEYLYQYVIELYKKITLKKIINDFTAKKKYKKAKKEFINYSNNLLSNEITNARMGSNLRDEWEAKLKIDETYIYLKEIYDTNIKYIRERRYARLLYPASILILLGTIISLLLSFKG